MPGSSVHIVDADGGRIAQLRPGTDEWGAFPVWSAPSGDRADWAEKIDSAASGDITIHTVPAGMTFRVQSVSFALKAAGSVIIKSGSGTKLSGSIRVGASVPYVWRAEGVPLIGAAAGDNLVLNVSGDTVTFPVIGGIATGWDAT